ncbi:MAG: hypothetical protein L3J83_04935 [Proteobacteria bacterium]|nr:hypothetical protein [Pseudomonadota bacterium]
MKLLGVITVLVFLVFLTVSIYAFAGKMVENHLHKMTDEAVSWEERGAAEDALMKAPSQQVLRMLLPYLEKGVPSGGIWNSAGREHDKGAPVEWQIFYAVFRSWDYQIESLLRNTGGTILLELLKETSASNVQIRLITDLTQYWVADAELTIAALLKEPKESVDVRIAAGLVLILNGKEDYHDLLLKYASESNHADRKRWQNLLLDPRHKKQTGVDSRVVLMGFDLIQAEQKQSLDYVHGAYFLAIKMGVYIGQEFMPDKNIARYDGKHGLTDVFFEDTIKNSLLWWKDNKEKIESSLQQGVP